MVQVLSVIHGPRWGGIHGIAERIAPELQRRGYQWTVVIPESSSESTYHRLGSCGVEVKRLPLRRIRRTLSIFVQLGYVLGVPIDIARLYNLIRRKNISIVQTCGLLHFQSAIAAKIAGIPVVWQIHSDQPPRFLKLIFTPIVSRLADTIMVSGERLIDTHPGLKCFRHKVYPFRAPVDTTHFTPSELLRTRARNMFSVGQGDIVIGTVGGRGPNKNHSLLVEAMAHVRHELPRAKCIIAGADQPSYTSWYKRHVIDRADDLGLLSDGTVQFVDPGAEVALFLNGFDIFVLPSKGEGASLVVAEAMACGLPVVANNVGAIADSVADGATGLLNQSLTVHELYKRILQLGQEPHTRCLMGTAARSFAVDWFSVGACTRAHIDAYDAARYNCFQS